MTLKRLLFRTTWGETRPKAQLFSMPMENVALFSRNFDALGEYCGLLGDFLKPADDLLTPVDKSI